MSHDLKAAGISTKLIHAGEDSRKHAGAVITPIYQTSTYRYDHDTPHAKMRYTRLSNTPSHEALHEKLAAVEGGEDALATSSGMSAITGTLLALLRGGDRVLAQSKLYGGTYALFTQEFPIRDIGVDFFDPTRPETWDALVRSTTKVLYVESISNPILEVHDLEKLAAFARAKGLTSVVDNTFASPINFNPLALGFDVVVHSCTKYINGHSDVIAGGIVASRAKIDRIRPTVAMFGGSLDPNSCFLLQRGMKTMELRVKKQNENALALATWLEKHPKVLKVNYPGLASSPFHANAKRWFRGFGGALSFELDAPCESVQRLVHGLRYFTPAPSLGGVESLIIRPGKTSHAAMNAEQKEHLGVRDCLVRASLGIENADDLVADFARALEAL